MNEQMKMIETESCRCIFPKDIGPCEPCYRRAGYKNETREAKIANVFDAIEYDGNADFYNMRTWFEFFDYFPGDFIQEVRKMLLPSIYLPDPVAFIQRWEWLKGIYKQWEQVNK